MPTAMPCAIRQKVGKAAGFDGLLITIIRDAEINCVAVNVPQQQPGNRRHARGVAHGRALSPSTLQIALPSTSG